MLFKEWFVSNVHSNSSELRIDEAGSFATGLFLYLSAINNWIAIED